MIYASMKQLKNRLRRVVMFSNNTAKVKVDKLISEMIDDLAWSAVFSVDADVRETAQWLIRRIGATLGIIPSSLQPVYEAMGEGNLQGFTIPAINLRTLTYQSAQAAFRAAKRLDVGLLIFEIARSEIEYTKQEPGEYAAMIIAAAIRTGYNHPIFIQGDHFQINAKKYVADSRSEFAAIQNLIKKAIAAGFFNIDIDTSTIVDLKKKAVWRQQEPNYSATTLFTEFIRSIEPSGISILIGGEIGEVGGKNSTAKELSAFMAGHLRELLNFGADRKGIGKISVQTGTTHGGIPLPDGSVAKIKLDFDTLKNLSTLSRKEYGLGGAVQHGASTLPHELFGLFPQKGTAEIHLATGFQNIIYDLMPLRLRNKIYVYLRNKFIAEKKDGETDEQFIYKTRKKALGEFKYDIWALPPKVMTAIVRALEKEFFFMFEKLGVADTHWIVDQCIDAIDVRSDMPTSK